MARLWPAADHVPTTVDPVSWFGQRSVLQVPAADRALHPHQTRPLHRIPTASCVLDLIQLEEPNPVLRMAKAMRLRASVRAARAVFTITAGVRDDLVGRFGVDPDHIVVLHLPVDRESAARVLARRRSQEASERYVLAVGRFDHHKNLRRLVEAFTQTRFAAAGGGLALAGGSVEELRAVGVAEVPARVKVLGRLGPERLEAALAGAVALVQASVTEGYGLPVAEALLAEVPVLSSPVPAATEFGPAGLPVFDPHSVPALRDALDRTLAWVDEGVYWERVDRGSWVAALPTTRLLAEEVLDGLDRMPQYAPLPRTTAAGVRARIARSRRSERRWK